MIRPKDVDGQYTDWDFSSSTIFSGNNEEKNNNKVRDNYARVFYVTLNDNRI